MSKARQRRESKQAEQAKKKGVPTRAQIDRLLEMGPASLVENPALLHTLLCKAVGPLRAHPDDAFLAKEFDVFKERFELFAAMREDIFLADLYGGWDLPPLMFVWDDEADAYQQRALSKEMASFIQDDYGLGAWFEEVKEEHGAKAAFLVLPFFTVIPALVVCCFSASGACWARAFIGNKWTSPVSIGVVNEYLRMPSPQSSFVACSEYLEEMHEEVFRTFADFTRRGREFMRTGTFPAVEALDVSDASEGLAEAAMHLWMEPCLRLGAIARARDEEVKTLTKRSALDLEQLEKQAALLKKAQADIEALKESNRHARDRELGYQRELLDGRAAAQPRAAPLVSSLSERLSAFF